LPPEELYDLFIFHLRKLTVELAHGRKMAWGKFRVDYLLFKNKKVFRSVAMVIGYKKIGTNNWYPKRSELKATIESSAFLV
jgi:hypothetical protein